MWVLAASIGTPVEGKIGTYTAEWTLENQGHPHDRQKPERCQRSGRAGLDRASITSQRTIETPPPAGLSIAAVYLSDSK